MKNCRRATNDRGCQGALRSRFMAMFISLAMAMSSVVTAAPIPPPPPLRMAISAAFVSENGIGIYNKLTRYLGNRLGRKVELYSGFSYKTITEMLDKGVVDIGLICGLSYILAHDLPQAQVELLVAPVMKDKHYQNKPIYYSYIIVGKDSPFQSFSDLRGKRFVYNEKTSNSGYNMPRAYLIEQGETNGYFSQTLRSGSHEESIRMVALGKADVSAVDSLVYDYERINNGTYTQQTRIIKTLGPVGIPPVVVSSKIQPMLRERIRDILVGMTDDPSGRRILDEALLDRFEVVEDSNYDDVRAMNNLAHMSGYMTIK